MKGSLLKIALAVCLVGAVYHIAWDKEAVKAFITGGVFAWAAMKFYKA